MLLSPIVASAQGAGRVVGIVRDGATGTPLKGATVTLRDPADSAARPLGAISDASGSFAIERVVEGKRYTLEALFVGYAKLVRRCRTMMGEAGAPVPRRGRGESEVPEGLRALGVTSREVDVLKLVVAGASNKRIAEELVLSPKTVERHLSSLFTRLGVANRRELADRGGPLLP